MESTNLDPGSLSIVSFHLPLEKIIWLLLFVNNLPYPIIMGLLVSTVTRSFELEQILQLQQENLVSVLPLAEIQSEGFVTMHHTFEILQQMHRLAPSIIIKDAEKVIAYALVMLRECRYIFPPLEPMFAVFDELYWKNKSLNSYQFYVMGQICIDKKYRGQGLFELLYEKHKEIYKDRYDCIVTEIALRNKRSMRAHQRIGFSTIHIYPDQLDEWAVVVWDWRNS